MRTSHKRRKIEKSSVVASISLLEGLPRELVWKIIELVPDTVLTLRSASSTLKSHVDTFATENTPIVEGMHFSGLILFQKLDDPTMRVTLGLPSSKRKLFALRLSLHGYHRSFGFGKKINRMRINSTSKAFCEFNILEDDDCLVDCMRKSIGRSIERIELFECCQQRQLDNVTKLFERAAIGKMMMYISKMEDTSASFLLNSVFANKIYHCHLIVSQCNITTSPVKLLMKLSTQLRSLHIYQRKIPGRSSTDDYFFGVKDIDWAPIFVKMLSSKLDKLYIENTEYPGYLWSRSAEKLIEQLPLLGKKLWFSASYSNKLATARSYVKNEHSVQTDLPNLDNSSLRIKHTSRIYEK